MILLVSPWSMSIKACKSARLRDGFPIWSSGSAKADCGKCGIAHTRWATHGEPSDLNSHPHTDVSQSIAVVHNGIIENHAQLRAWLEKHQVTFASQTDSEVIAHLIDFHYNGDLLLAVTETVKRLEGSYAIAVA